MSAPAIPLDERKLSRGGLFRSLGGILADRAEDAVESAKSRFKDDEQLQSRSSASAPSGSGSPAAISSVAASTLPHVSTRSAPGGARPLQRVPGTLGRRDLGAPPRLQEVD